MFMIPRVVTDCVTTCPGAAMPTSIGPTDSPSPTVFNRLLQDHGLIEIDGGLGADMLDP